MTETTQTPLEEAIRDYLGWIKLKRRSTRIRYEKLLSDFALFVKNEHIPWQEIFTLDTLKRFRKHRDISNGWDVIRGLSDYLFTHGRISQPLRRSKHQIDLPDIYEQYLLYYEKIKQLPHTQTKCVRRVLASFHGYLEKSQIPLSSLKIGHVDAFLAQFNEPFAASTCRIYRGYLRGFLSYLYHQRQILPTDLAPRVVGPPTFCHTNPLKFLRSHQLQRLFDSLALSSDKDIRTYAMVHLAYFLGLRPKEITLISLDDIAFTQAQLTVTNRKNNRPVKLPLPEATLKAIVAYLVGSRPKSHHRSVFLSLRPPHRPITPSVVIHSIKDAMRKAGLRSSTYWLRHTYAQNLLEAGASLYEIKDMLGHESIESTRKYLHIHIKLMRETLFDETL
jgi:site-specific recombinase XerD